jgi:hypothetical protein
MDKKKPAKHGLDYVRNSSWNPKQFTRKGAQRYADNWAKKSPIKNAVGLVADCGEYWRINIAGQPMDN